MSNTVHPKFISKRFLTFLIAVAIFTVMVYTTNYSPLELAGAITGIAAIYIGAETLRSTN